MPIIFNFPLNYIYETCLLQASRFYWSACISQEECGGCSSCLRLNIKPWKTILRGVGFLQEGFRKGFAQAHVHDTARSVVALVTRNTGRIVKFVCEFLIGMSFVSFTRFYNSDVVAALSRFHSWFFSRRRSWRWSFNLDNSSGYGCVIVTDALKGGHGIRTMVWV